MPGFCLCLGFAYAWILPMPGFCLCLGFAYAWISPMPGFCLCLDFAYALIFYCTELYHLRECFSLSTRGAENELPLNSKTVTKQSAVSPTISGT